MPGAEEALVYEHMLSLACVCGSGLNSQYQERKGEEETANRTNQVSLAKD